MLIGFFDAANFEFAAALGAAIAFFVPTPASALALSVVDDVDDFARPFGSGPFDFACACAFSHPSKSGSPPSSKAADGGGGGGASADFGSEGASKNDSSPSPMAPHASSSSSSSSCASAKNWSVDVRVRIGWEEDAADEVPAAARAWRWSVEVEEAGAGRYEDGAVVATGEAEDGRSSVERGGGWSARLGLDCISPVAAASLWVKDEMAQPDQEVSFWGVPMRGVVPFTAPFLGVGRAVSGSEFPYLRVRCK